MPAIKLLSDDVINKISAGEVIERPASVVKELLENSLDAGASHISVEIKKGGTKHIRVSDNGIGIEEEDVLTAMQRHATSKITCLEDLSKINSLGFRGEALPSIASVSKFGMITRPKNRNTGFAVKMSGDRNPELQKTGCAAGTTMIIEDLFFNTPARLKFLKSNATETLHITNLVQQIALSCPEINIELKEDGRKILGPLPKNQTPLQRIASLFGSRVADNLVPVHSENNFIKLSGFITKPALNYPNNKYQFFFINKRSIRSRLLGHAVMKGYGSLLANKRYAGVFLFIEIKPEFIDVNIHPTKREIRFTNENAMHTFVVETLQKFLRQQEVIPEIQASPAYEKPDIARDGRIKEAISDYITRNKSSYRSPARRDLLKQEKFDYRKEKEEFEKTLTDTMQPLAQINNTYIIAQGSDGMFIIDQHAAWERINYEIFKSLYGGNNISSQSLLIPMNLELPSGNAIILKDNIQFFSKMGFEISEFGENSYIINAIPAMFGDRIDYKQLLSDMLDLISESKGQVGSSSGIDELTDGIFKIMACRASVKAGDNLSREEMEELIKGLNKCSIPYSCPHGRPTMIKMSTDELEKRFKRK